MSEYFSNKIDFIIMIVLALLVAFIIGFNILQLIDSKLSSVTINVPSNNCSIPPIYLNIDKDSNIKQIKLNDVISTVSNESDNNIEGFSNLDNSYYNYEKEQESFGNLQDYPLMYDDNRRHLISSVITEPKANKVIEQKTIYETTQDPNYNTLNDIPLLVAPDTDVPNKAGPDAKGYYASKVKLIEDTNSPLMKLAKSNADKINKVVAKCTLADANRVPEVNGTFDGYNAFVDLRTDSYANVTSIGKSMLSPYVSYPVPS
jgi:DNA-dependent RNA polymerase auxiliary subunit epsilon